MTDENLSLFFTGNIHEVKLPDSRTVKIRENNGEDEGILSRVSDTIDGNNILNFLSGILSLPGNENRTTLPGEVDAWKRNSAFYLLFKQRLINIGYMLDWKEICGNNKCSHEFSLSQDLREFDYPIEQDKKESSIQYSPFAITDYPNKEEMEVVKDLPNGKTIRFNIESLADYRKRMTTNSDGANINQNLLNHKLALRVNGQFMPMKTFGMFSSKEMGQMRTMIKMYDPVFDPILRWNCPKCNMEDGKRLFVLPDFYYPEVAI